MPGPTLDLTRPECRQINNRIKELRRELRRWAERLRDTRDPEERENILHTMDGLENSISSYEEQLYENGCYVSPQVIVRLLAVAHVERTQATQYYSLDGTNAGADNAVWAIEGKPTLLRCYLTTTLTDVTMVGGTLRVMGFNPTSLKYDIFRTTVPARAPLTLIPGVPLSRRSLADTLNFVVPAAICWGNVLFEVTASAVGHESDPPTTNPSYQTRFSISTWFTGRRVPIVHCFRIDLSRNMPGPPTPLPFAAPTFAACQNTMAEAVRMYPVSHFDIRDRGTRAFSGPLNTLADYDAVLQDIMTVYNATTPTPARNELYVAMLPAHGNANVFGEQLAGSMQTTVDRQQLFSHEIGHWLLPGDDHVEGCTNPTLPMTQIDVNYPDYANAISDAGIGEWGVDISAAGVDLFSPEAGEIMSYCGGIKWISPYNYLRAFNGPVLSWAPGAVARQLAAEKLIIAFRLQRDETAQLQWALHLPGEPPDTSGKGATDLVLELHGENGRLLTSTACHLPADRGRSAPYEDFQEVLPWFDAATFVVLVKGSRELARWPVEAPMREPEVPALSVTSADRTDGRGNVIRLGWTGPRDAKARHYMLRYSPDDGKTWIPVANGVAGHALEISDELLRGVPNARFQLAVSTGFRTTLVESETRMGGARLDTRPTIAAPAAGTSIREGEAIELAGSVPMRFDGVEGPPHAYWTSHRDGFLAEGLQARVQNLSPGRHSIRLIVEDEHGTETAQAAVVVWVTARGQTTGD
jgi:hypothetical protein